MDTKMDRGAHLIAHNTLMLYLRMALVTGITLYTSRIVLEQLGVVDYGIFNVVGGIVVMLAFINGAMAQSTQRFLAYEIGAGDTSGLSATFRTALTVHLLIAICVFCAAETLGLRFLNHEMEIPADRIVAANWVYQCSIVSFLLSICQVPFHAVIIARERMGIYARMGVLEVILKLGIAFVLALGHTDKLRLYALLVMGVNVTVNCIYLIYCHYRFEECSILGLLFDKKRFFPMVGFASWNAFGTLSWVTKTQGCNLILNLFFGPAVNAAYSISMQVNTALNRFVQGFTTAINPQVVKRYSAGDFATFENLVISGSKMSFMLLLFPVFVLMLVTDDVLRLWLGEVPEYSVVFVKLVLLNSLLESMTNSMSTAVQATGRIRSYQVIVGLTLVMNLPLSWVMLRFGLPPATVPVIVIALSLVTLGERVVILKRVVPQISVGKFVRRVFIPLGGVGGISAVVYIVGRCLLLSGRIHPVPAAVAGLLVVALAEYVVGLDSRERAVVRDYICSKIHLAG